VTKALPQCQTYWAIFLHNSVLVSEWKIYHSLLVQCSVPNNTSNLSEYAVGLTSGRVS
jgi:hypothetical protein